jgi:hypothetical protein
MKKSLYLAMFFLCALVSAGECKTQKVVFLSCGDTFDVDGIGAARPLRTLAKALKANTNSPKFRVKWFCAPPNGSSACHIAYDRSAHTLSFYSKSEAFGMGTEGFKPVYIRWRLKRVTDDMIIKLAGKHPRDDYDPGDSYFSDLATLGAKKY